MHWDLADLIRAVGYLGLFAIVFAESGLFFGFFLPGDSLLFTAGFLASQGMLNLGLLIALFVVAAITGDAVGYTFGRRVGRRFFERKDSRWFKDKHLQAAEAFYEKHGGKTVVIARFIPVVRTFAPIVAGMANMRYRRFAVYNIAGGALWGGGVTLAGYLLGSVVPDVDRYLLPIILAIIVISALPTGVHLARAHRDDLWTALRFPRRQQPASIEVEVERQPEKADGTGLV
ncbi:MAG: DedA family protein [Chloroflexota bacterium]|nr:MAG: DedA family protein [Chloroflexota bacterium]